MRVEVILRLIDIKEHLLFSLAHHAVYRFINIQMMNLCQSIYSMEFFPLMFAPTDAAISGNYSIRFMLFEQMGLFYF